jgi:hypothetical protein
LTDIHITSPPFGYSFITAGWSALMWAANNNHEDIVRTLIEYGGCPTPKSNSGCSVFDFINKENKSLNDLLARNSRDSISSISSFGPGHSGRSSSPSSFGSEADLSSRDWSNFDASLKSPSYDERFDGDFDDVDEFKWDECLLHQMFVFDTRKLPKILDTVTFKMDLPPKSRQEIFVPASIIYLCARFAHYYCDAETVELVLSEAMKRLRKCVQVQLK